MSTYKKYLLLLFCFACFSVKAQQVNILNFKVSPKLPADVTAWTNMPGAVILVAQTMVPGNISGIKPVIQIKQGGSKICGNAAPSTAPMDSFRVHNFSTGEITSFLAQCPKLAPGRYSLCVQFFNIDNRELGHETCRDFSVEDESPQNYTAPLNTAPANEKSFRAEDAKAPITFRWTPLVPKPHEPVTYRIKVWQLMEGQSGGQAMRANEPIEDKEVDNRTQAIIANLYTGPCKPPYLCDFIWSIDAVDHDGKIIQSSLPTTFKIETAGEKYSPPQNMEPAARKIFTPEAAKGSLTFRWTPVTPPQSNNNVTYRIKVWQLMEGQNGSQAMRTNKPIVVKDVSNMTEATFAGLYTGPCKPPYLCDFVWNVEASKKSATGDMEMLGQSASSMYSVAAAAASCCPGTWGAMQWCNMTSGPCVLVPLPPCNSNLGIINTGSIYNFNVVYNCVPGCGPNQILYNIYTASGSLYSTTPGSSGVNTSVTMPTGSPANYILKIYAVCGGTTCDSCLYQFTTTVPSCCTGSTWGIKKWGFTAATPNPLIPFGTVNAGCNPNIYFNVTYNCVAGCAASIIYKFYNSSGVLISNYPYAPGPTPAIPIPATATYFVVFAQCGSQVCDSIVNKITVIPPCTGSSWGSMKYRPAPLPNLPWQILPCNTLLLPMHQSSLTRFRVFFNCACGTAQIKYTVTGPSAYFWASPLVPSGTIVFAPMPPTTGWGTVTIQAYCNGVLCKTCVDKLKIVP